MSNNTQAATSLLNQAKALVSGALALLEKDGGSADYEDTGTWYCSAARHDIDTALYYLERGQP